MGRTDWQPNNNHALCSEHFEKNCIDFRDQRPRLRKGSIPTIFHKDSENDMELAVGDERSALRQPVQVEIVHNTNKSMIYVSITFILYHVGILGILWL